jgi:hypothetical protein
MFGGYFLSRYEHLYISHAYYHFHCHFYPPHFLTFWHNTYIWIVYNSYFDHSHPIAFEISFHNLVLQACISIHTHVHIFCHTLLMSLWYARSLKAPLFSSMDNQEDIQNKSIEQILRDELQSLRKEKDDLAKQVQTLMAQQLQQLLHVQQAPNQHTPLATATTPPVNTSVTLNVPNVPADNTTLLTATSKQTNDQMEYILKKLKMLEGNEGTEDLAKFCIIDGLEIPRDFKVPDFEKYDGITGEIDPNVHLQMYCSKMGPYMKDEKLMMHYFQESLKGPAVKWYLNLDKRKMQIWGNLASAFLKQYQHNADFAPDKSSLKKLSMNKNEDFRSFALRWRNQAARVEPPMTEKELVDVFIEIECLNQQFKFSCANAIDFAHLVRTGIRIEAALKVNGNDKFENTMIQ